MKLYRWCLGAAVLALAACDATFENDHDAPDADDASDASEPGALGSPYGADPASHTFVDGPSTYTPSDPELAGAGLVRFDGRHLANGSRIIAEGLFGPLIASAGADAAALAAGVAAPTPVVDHAAETGRWLVVGGHAVIAEGPEIDLAWATMAPGDDKHAARIGDLFAAELPLDLTRVPDAIRNVIGADVRVFDRDSEVCLARVTGLTLEARLIHESLGPWIPEYSPSEIFARGLRTVVATLEPLAGASRECERGVVAVGVRAPSPALYREAPIPSQLANKARAAMCALPAWRQAAGLFDRDARPWSAPCAALAERAELHLYETRMGDRIVVVGADGLQAGFRANGPKLANTWAYAPTVPTHAEGIIDVQNDGMPELILSATERAPATVVGLTFAGDLSEPTFLSDWTPVAPRRMAVGGFAVPDFSVYRPRH